MNFFYSTSKHQVKDSLWYNKTMFEKKPWLTEKRRQALDLLDLHTVEDVLTYFPRRYADYSPTPCSSVQHLQRVCVHAIVQTVSKMAFIRRNFSKFTIILNVDGEEFKVPIFNRPFLYKNIKVGALCVVAGKLDYWKHEITGTDIFPTGINEDAWLQPLYPLKAGIAQHYFRSLMAAFLHNSGHQIVDIVPTNYQQKYHLLPRDQALIGIHQPRTREQLGQSLHTLKYEEFFVFSLRQLLAKVAQRSIHGDALAWDTAKSQQWQHSLPYTLTSDQVQAIDEIYRDLQSDHAMYRLLQGDVGSGKTVVAAAALAAVVWSGHQGVLMAPTEILARQHYQTLSYLLPSLQSQMVFLTGSTSTSERQAIYQGMSDGTYTIVIGTHAVFQEKVNFLDLRLAIIDEQHRFGVEQRLKLKQKGHRVDLLMLSATPIPRTLAMTLYGDMDISTLTQFPSQQRHVQSTYLTGSSIKAVLPAIEKELTSGGQLYVICPLIEASEEESSGRSALEVHQSLSTYYRGRFKVGLLHGQLTNDEKNEAMRRFQSGETPILVATTVVEVGVDVKQASQMVIYDAESFGLSQLHQLRGRIGRAGQPGYCYVLSADTSENVRERLTYFCQESDGFELARYDLEHRGPGDLLGLRQSGFAEFLLGDFHHDMKLLDQAQKDALDWLRHQPLKDWPMALRDAVMTTNEMMADMSAI